MKALILEEKLKEQKKKLFVDQFEKLLYQKDDK